MDGGVSYIRGLLIFEKRRSADDDTQAAQGFGVHRTMIHQWKRQLLERAPDVFERGRKGRVPAASDDTVRDLHAEIGEMAVANDFLSQNLKPWDVRRAMVEKAHILRCR